MGHFNNKLLHHKRTNITKIYFQQHDLMCSIHMHTRIKISSWKFYIRKHKRQSIKQRDKKVLLCIILVDLKQAVQGKFT